MADQNDDEFAADRGFDNGPVECSVVDIQVQTRTKTIFNSIKTKVQFYAWIYVLVISNLSMEHSRVKQWLHWE